MKKVLLSVLLALIALPVLAQTGVAVRLRSDSDCETEVCVAVGQVCVTGATIYCCNVAGGNFDPCGSAGGAGTFLALTDTPNSYAGQTLKVVRVNAGETALEFATAGAGAALTCEEADGAPTVASVTKIQFDQADGFTVTDETGGQVQIDFTPPDNSVALTTKTTGDYVSSATANQGLLLTGTEGGSLGLQDCAADEVLRRNTGDTAWECVAREPTKVVTICASGCDYTTLNAACAAETSTAANPIEYRVGPGVFTGENSCSGEDHATFRGSGQGTTIMERPGVTFTEGTLELGTSSNITVTGFTFQNGNRQVWWDAGTTNVGVNHFTNNEFKTAGTTETEDCVFVSTTGGAAGTFYFNDNSCTSFADGFTFANKDDVEAGTATIKVYSSGNRFFTYAVASQRVAGFFLGTTPCMFMSSGDQFHLVGSKGAGGASTFYAYAWAGVNAPQCPTSSYGYINGATAWVQNTGTNGQSASAVFATFNDELDEVHIVGSTAVVQTSDSTTGQAYGVSVETGNATTNVIVEGGRYRASGGLASNTWDFQSAVAKAITYLGTDWVTFDTGRATPTVINQRDISVTASATFTSPATIAFATTGDADIGMTLDNTDEANAETSPYLIMKNSTVAADDDQFSMVVDSGGVWRLRHDNFSEAIEVPQSTGSPINIYHDFGVLKQHAFLQLGDGSASDNTEVWFNAATTDGHLTWIDTNNELQFRGPTDSTGGIAIDDQMGLRFYEEDGSGTNYQELKGPATLAANRTHTLNIVDATCTGDGNGGALTIVAGEIVCSADDGGAGSGDNIRVEDGDNAGTYTVAADADFEDSADINFTLDGGPTPDTITGTIRADAVALITDTSGNFVGSITGGAGIAASAAGEGTAVTVDTASSEENFLASGALTCGAATRGKMQVHTTPLQYCDNAGTPALQYAAYAASDGDASAGDSATAFFDAGQIEAARGGTADDTSGTTGVPRIATGNWTYDAGVSHLAASTSADLRGVLSDETGTGVAVFSAPTAFTLDVEGGSNSITTVSKVFFQAATCQNATAYANFDTPTSNAAAAACITGTNTQKGVLDFDQTTDESVQGMMHLPPDWTGNIDVEYKWLTTAITGSVTWCLQIMCTNDAETDDSAFTAQNSSTCVSDAAKGTTNQLNEANDTAVTAGTGTPGACAAGELMHFRVSRDPDQTAGLTDDLAADARLVAVEITVRRAQ